ncbi:MAG: segregation and condensation protein A [Sphingobacteriaceae bacterium]
MKSATDLFEIKLPKFEGPFDLLLFFIERDELNIHDIPIAKITDDFLAYIHELSSLNMEVASEFIYVAATLMRIKAKMLLPRQELDAEGNEIDHRQDLVQKLLEYKRFKEVAETLKSLEETRFLQEKRGNIPQDLAKIIAETAIPGEELTSLDLYKLMLTHERLLSKYEVRNTVATHTVVQYPYTIEKQKQVILNLLSINSKLDFKAIQAQSENKVQFVYNFLALLEMLQQQLAEIHIGLGYNNFWVEAH